MSSVLTGIRPGLAARPAVFEYDRRGALGHLVQTACVEKASMALDQAQPGWVVASVDIHPVTPPAHQAPAHLVVTAAPADPPAGAERRAPATLWYRGGRPVDVGDLAKAADLHPQGLTGALVSEGSIGSARDSTCHVGQVDVSCVRLHFLPAGMATTAYVQLRAVGAEPRA